MAQGIHLEQRRDLGVVGEVIGVLALEVRRDLALSGDEPDFLPFFQDVGDEGQRESAEVGAPPEAGDDEVRIVVEEGELFLGFLSDDRLMRDMVEDRTQAVVAWGSLRVLGLGNGDAER
jgi:hypothetical protein